MINIRPCTEADLARVVALSKKWADENITLGYENVAWSEEKLRSRLNGYFFVAEAGRTIVGYGFGEVKKGNAGPVIEQGEPYLEIHEVYVEPRYRMQGIGTKLVERLLAKCEENRITRFLVGSANIRWADTVRFYEKLGFHM